MGGIGFVFVISLVSFLALPAKTYPLVGLFIGFALIGFLDDFFKIIRKQNQGLTFWQKIFFQAAAASAFLFSLNISGLYFYFCLFVVVGAANATNLTDGLDGLLAGSAAITFLFFGYLLGSSPLAFIAAGGLLGFLLYNFPKAKVFMGDVGALPVGAVMAGLAIVSGKILVLAVISGLFIAEALSVIIQVSYFKFFKKRIFRMTPLHHHFELLGWSELKVVLVFWGASLIFGVLAVLLGSYAL